MYVHAVCINDLQLTFNKTVPQLKHQCDNRLTVEIVNLKVGKCHPKLLKNFLYRCTIQQVIVFIPP